MQPGLTIAFAGTPAFAASIFRHILNDRSHTVSLVYTQQDKPAGRGRKVQKSPVKELAEQYQLPIRQPENRHQLQLDTDLDGIDVMIVAAYGMLIPADVLARPRYGCINIHTSLLPRWRGAAPVQRALLGGDRETGITIMQMDTGLDTGDILYQQPCPIMPSDTAGALFEKLAIIGSECILRVLSDLSKGNLQATPQPITGVTYAHKIQKSEGEIDWHQPAAEIDRKIRAFNPAPVAYTLLNGEAVRLWQARILDLPVPADTPPGTIVGYSAAGLDIATSDRIIRVLKLQLPGKRAMDCRDFYNGNPQFVIDK